MVPGSNNLDFLYNVTIKNPQYRASDFAKISNFSYSKGVTEKNINLALFSYGSIKHLLLLANGTLPAVSRAEFISRLQHTLNVLDIACLGSQISDFDSHAWRTAKDYDFLTIKEIQEGYKTWETLRRSIDSTIWDITHELNQKQT